MKHCTTDKCPQILDSSCVFYEGANLIFSGINTNDSVEVVIQKLNLKLESIPVFNLNNYYTKSETYSKIEINNFLSGKQNIIGYTPENVSNKSDSYTASSSTTYASTKALVDGLDTKLDKGTYTGTAQDLKTEIDGKANTDASNIDDNLHIWRQKIDANYVHDQAQPSSIWTINHPLNKKVSVTITDTAGTVVEGQVIINDNSQVIITFNNPFSGIAVLN